MYTKPLPSQQMLQKHLRYDSESGLVFRHDGTPAFQTRSISGYLCGTLFGQKYRAHRIIWKLIYGTEPELIDHIDGVRTNNLLANLRSVTEPENQKNRRLSISSKSGVNGVHWCKASRAWIAKITINRRAKALGRFHNIDDAIAARKAAERQHGFHENHGSKVG